MTQFKILIAAAVALSASNTANGHRSYYYRSRSWGTNRSYKTSRYHYGSYKSRCVSGMTLTTPANCEKESRRCCELKEWMREQMEDMDSEERREFWNKQMSDDADRVCCSESSMVCPFVDGGIDPNSDDPLANAFDLPVSLFDARCIPDTEQCDSNAGEILSDSSCCLNADGSGENGCEESQLCCLIKKPEKVEGEVDFGTGSFRCVTEDDGECNEGEFELDEPAYCPTDTQQTEACPLCCYDPSGQTSGETGDDSNGDEGDQGSDDGTNEGNDDGTNTEDTTEQ